VLPVDRFGQRTLQGPRVLNTDSSFHATPLPHQALRV